MSIRTPLFNSSGTSQEAEETAPTGWRSRPQVLVVAVALLLVLVGALAFVLVGGDTPEPASTGATTGPRVAPTDAPEVPVPDPGGTGKARNPFAAAEGADDGSDDGGSQPRATVTVTRTAAATTVTYVSLFRLGSGSNPTADLAVNGIGYANARPGDVLGKGSTAVTFSGAASEGECVVLKHRKRSYPLCIDEMLRLG